MMKTNNSLLLFLLTWMLMISCNEEVEYYPKPKGYMRLYFPERTYSLYDNGCTYSFEIPDYFTIVDKDSFCNMKDVLLERFNATINLTYIPVDTNLTLLIERSRSLVYEHTIFADAIEEQVIIDPSRKAYGLRYSIVGNAASPYQFYITDSTDNFLRGALYFNVSPNYDSIRTSLDYITEDIDRMISTITWK